MINTHHFCFVLNQQYKKPVEVSAPEYVDLLMTWCESQLNDENIFPSKIGELNLIALVIVIASIPKTNKHTNEKKIHQNKN